jgi:hypothetical protein
MNTAGIDLNLLQTFHAVHSEGASAALPNGSGSRSRR